jgi:hypothetical protein
MRQVAHAAAVLLCIALLGGCGSIQAPLPPSLELPLPPNDLRAVRKGDRVYLFWSIPKQTLDKQNIRTAGPVRVCRSLDAHMERCGTPIGYIDPARNSGFPNTAATSPIPQAMFIDRLPPELRNPPTVTTATYAVEAMNLHARSAGLSNEVQVALAPTSPAPTNFHGEVTKDGVILSWECTPPAEATGMRSVSRIYRRSADRGLEVKLADVECPTQRFEDQTIEWEKPYEYRITTVTLASLAKPMEPCPTKPERQETVSDASCRQVEIEGEDSAPQKIFTKDVYPPGLPTGLQAVYSGPGQVPFIDLLWAPVIDSDLAGYYVYRRAESGQPARINSELLKTPAFRDSNVEAGKTYWYSVSAVDSRGNESSRSEEASESVPSGP